MLPYVPSDKFRSPIKAKKVVAKPNAFIEKNQFRIDSRGERQGITVKGLLAQEEKRRKARIKSAFKRGGDAFKSDSLGFKAVGLKPLKMQSKPSGILKSKSAFGKARFK